MLPVACYFGRCRFDPTLVEKFDQEQCIYGSPNEWYELMVYDVHKNKEEKTKQDRNLYKLSSEKEKKEHDELKDKEIVCCYFGTTKKVGYFEI